MSTFKELIETYGKQLSFSLTHYVVKGESTAMHKAYGASELRSVNTRFDGALFTAVMRCMDIVMEGNAKAPLNIGTYWGERETIAKGDKFTSSKLTASANGESKTIDYGTFYVAETPEYDESSDTTKIVCYDSMYLTMKPYSLEVDFPVTLKNYLLAVASAVGITVANADELRNGDMLITEDRFSGVAAEDGNAAYTFRDVLNDIARCAGCSFTFKSSANGNSVNQMYVVYVTDGNGNMAVTKDENENEYVLDIDNFKSLTLGADYGPINSVIYSRQPQEDNVYLYGDGITAESAVSVKLTQPELADSNDDGERVKWLDGVLSAVRGLRYKCFSFESYGIGYLNFGDVFKIKTYDKADGTFDYDSPQEYVSVFMRSDMTVDTDIKESAKLELPEATSTEYNAAYSATEKSLIQAYLRVDKKVGKIEALITSPDDGLQAQLTATAEKVSAAIEKITTIEEAGYITTEKANSLIEAKANSIAMSVTGSLKYGVNNLLIDSAACFMTKEPAFSFISAVDGTTDTSVSYDDAVPSEEYAQFDYTANGYGSGVYFVYPQNTIGDISKLQKGATYTLSFYARGGCQDVEVNFIPKYLAVYNGDFLDGDIVTGKSHLPPLNYSEWQRYILVFTVSKDVEKFVISFRTDAPAESAVNLSISSVQLEVGDKATQWRKSEDEREAETEAKLSLYVKRDDYNSEKIISFIEAYADIISLNAKSGLVFNNGAFAIDEKGYITSTGGTLGGWNIKENCLYSDYGDYRAYIQTPSSSGQWIFSTQKKNGNSYVGTFLVKANGDLHTNNIKDIDGNIMVEHNSEGQYVFGYGANKTGASAYYEGGNNLYVRTSGSEICIQSLKDGAYRTNFRIGGGIWTTSTSGTDYRDHIVSAGGLIISANHSEASLYLEGKTVYINSVDIIKRLTTLETKVYQLGG